MKHTVSFGETLGTIAQKYLGSSTKWRDIWNANPAITNPDVIRVGQVLTIPEVYGPPVPTGGNITPQVTAAPVASSFDATKITQFISSPTGLAVVAALGVGIIVLATQKPKSAQAQV